MRTPRFLLIALYRFLHPQGRVARPYGMVLVGERRAEQRHDAVAHDLIDRALVAVHGLHHVLEDRIEELTRLLGITVREQLLGRSLHIREEHGDLLALALERTLRAEDPLDKVLGGVSVRRGESFSQRETGAASHTEMRLDRIVLLAPRTRHAAA